MSAKKAPASRKRPVAKKPTIAIFSTTEGHLSLAQAAAGQLEDHYNVKLLVIRESLLDFYLPIYQYFPQGMSAPFEMMKSLSRQKKARELIEQFCHYRYEERLEKFLAEVKPVAVLSSYFLFNPTLERYQRLTGVPLFNLIADPHTIHPLIISQKARANIVFDNQARKTVKGYWPMAKVKTAGWLVRPTFEKKFLELNKKLSDNDSVLASVAKSLSYRQIKAPDSKILTKQLSDQKRAARRALGYDESLPHFLITSGSEGTTLIAKLLPALVMINRPAHFIIACGGNTRLVKMVKTFADLLGKRRSALKLTPLSFVDNLEDYMLSSDLIIGKAGPNTIFEAAATLRPFMAITHISGQETGNLDLIRHYKIGLVEENPLKAQKLLSRFLENPSLLQKFSPHLWRLAKYNSGAGKILEQLLKKHSSA